MEVLYFNSFLRVFKRFPCQQQDKIKEAVTEFISRIENKTAVSQGMGLKKLSRSLWEIRVGIDLRIIFSIDSAVLNVIFAGTHDEIRKYLKRNR